MRREGLGEWEKTMGGGWRWGRKEEEKNRRKINGKGCGNKRQLGISGVCLRDRKESSVRKGIDGG